MESPNPDNSSEPFCHPCSDKNIIYIILQRGLYRSAQNITTWRCIPTVPTYNEYVILTIAICLETILICILNIFLYPTTSIVDNVSWHVVVSFCSFYEQNLLLQRLIMQKTLKTSRTFLSIRLLILTYVPLRFKAIVPVAECIVGQARRR